VVREFNRRLQLDRWNKNGEAECRCFPGYTIST
jgi:hypothetical protein